MWIAIGIALALAVVVMLLSVALVQKRRRRRIKNMERQVFQGIAAGISSRLHAAYPGSKWKWVCRPVGFAANGGIARIEVVQLDGKKLFVDVCYSVSGYMALHVSNVVELTASDGESTPLAVSENVPRTPAQATVPAVNEKPSDEESVTKWYNIVLINALTALIDDLNADGEVCLHIGEDGKAFVDSNKNAVLYDFGEMPDVAFWEQITEKLSGAGLFAEVQDGNCIFVSWV